MSLHLSKTFCYTSPFAFTKSKRGGICWGCQAGILYTDHFWLINFDHNRLKGTPTLCHAQCLKKHYYEGYHYVLKTQRGKLTPELLELLETPFEFDDSCETQHLLRASDRYEQQKYKDGIFFSFYKKPKLTLLTEKEKASLIDQRQRMQAAASNRKGTQE